MRYGSNSECVPNRVFLAFVIMSTLVTTTHAQVVRSHDRSFVAGTSYGSGRSIFGSPFANQPFSISGMNGSLSGNLGVATGGFGGAGLGIGGNFGCGNGPFGGLGIVAPGWWGLGPGPGVGYWGAGYGLYPSAWWVGGWNTGFAGLNNWPIGWGFGPGWGWNPGFFPNVWNQGFVWDRGFLGAMENVVFEGNARFGPARPVRQQRAAGGNGIGMPPNPNGGGLNAVAPNAPFAAVPRAMPPNFVEIANLRQIPAPANPVAAFPDRLQTADRLARNGLYEEASKRYQAVAEKHPEDPAPWFRIAQIQALADRPVEALKAFAEGESRSKGQFSNRLKSSKWADIADSTTIAKLKDKFDRWSKSPELAGIEKLRATLTSGEIPAVAQIP